MRAAGDVRLRQPFSEAQVLATGGFAARLARERGLVLRANPWSEGDGLAYGLARGADLSGGMDEFYGRALPAPVDGGRNTSRLRSCTARHALVLDDDGRELGEPAWHESDLVQRFPDGTAWYVVDARALRERVRDRTVAELVEAARARRRRRAPCRTSCPSSCPTRRSSSSRRSPRCGCTRPSRTRSAACGSTSARGCSIRTATPVAGLYAAGADAGGIFTGGYGSGLAAALVYGRIAAETALS